MRLTALARNDCPRPHTVVDLSRFRRRKADVHDLSARLACTWSMATSVAATGETSGILFAVSSRRRPPLVATSGGRRYTLLVRQSHQARHSTSSATSYVAGTLTSNSWPSIFCIEKPVEADSIDGVASYGTLRTTSEQSLKANFCLRDRRVVLSVASGGAKFGLDEVANKTGFRR